MIDQLVSLIISVLTPSRKVMIFHETPTMYPPFLVRNSAEKVTLKSFKEEVRAEVDLKNFIADSRVVLDLDESDIAKILEVSISRVSISLH